MAMDMEGRFYLIALTLQFYHLPVAAVVADMVDMADMAHLVWVCSA